VSYSLENEQKIIHLSQKKTKNIAGIFGRLPEPSVNDPKPTDPDRRKKILRYIKIGILSGIALFFMFGVGSLVLYYLTVTGYLLEFLNWITEIG
jgi:hypothetical protein